MRANNHHNYLISSKYIWAAACLSLVGAGSSAYARDGWRTFFGSEVVYDFNPLTRSDDFSIDDIIGNETTASLVFKRDLRRTSLYADLSYTRNQFNETEFNSNDISLLVRARQKIKRWVLSFTGEAKKDTTRTSQFDTFGQSNVVVGRRDSFSIAPSLVYSVSPRINAGINTNWDQKDYANATGLVDHRTYSLSPFVSYNYSPRQTFSLAMLYQDYTSLEGADVNVESIGPFVTWDYEFLPRTMLTLSLGLLSTEFDGVGTSNDREINPIYSLEIEHEGKRFISTLKAERARRASSDGSENDITSVDFRNVYTITPRWDLDLRANYQKAESSEFASSSLDQSYSGTIGTTYDISRRLSFSTSYRYVNESFNNNRSDATRNVVRAGLEYSFY